MSFIPRLVLLIIVASISRILAKKVYGRATEDQREIDTQLSAVMVLVLSGLGYITYITFADAILAHKQQIASLRLENIRLRVAENSDPTGHLGQAELLQSLQSKDSFGESFVLLSQGEQLLLDSSNQALTEHQQLLGDLLAAAVTDELVKVGDVYAIHDSLPRSQLDLWYLIPESEFLASLIELKNRVVVATIIILWASIWVVLIIAHKISGPIRHLSRATEAMQKTEYSKPLKFDKTVMRSPTWGNGLRICVAISKG